MGNTPATGQSHVEGAAIRVVATGSDIWFASDSFHFVYLPVEGDVDVRARVAVLSYVDSWAKAGVMVRDGVGADAVHGFMGLTPAGPSEFIWRSATGGESASTVRYEIGSSGWVRLVRRGSTLTSYVSPDGVSWTEFDTATLPFGESVAVGVAVTSRSSASSAEALAEHVQVRDGEGQLILPGIDEDTPPPSPRPPMDETPLSDWVCGDQPLQPAFAPTLFVATNGSDSADGRSIDRPLRTLQRAADIARAGDVVWVRGGTYPSDVTFRNSGTSTTPIVFESHPGECAILDGDLVSGTRRVTLAGVNHMIFRNFIVRNSPAEGIYLDNSDHNQITHVQTHHNYWSGITVAHSDHNLFAYFISHDNFDPPNGGDADGINVNSGDRNRIDRCIVYNNSDDGVDTWRSTNTLVERCVAFDNGWQGGDGIGIKAGGGERRVHTVVRWTVAFANKAHGFDSNSGRGNLFERNTAFANGRYGFLAGDATLRGNAALLNELADYSDGRAPNRASGNSWNARTPGLALRSTHPDDPEFAVIAGAAGLGALALDETLLDVFGWAWQQHRPERLTPIPPSP